MLEKNFLRRLKLILMESYALWLVGETAYSCNLKIYLLKGFLQVQCACDPYPLNRYLRSFCGAPYVVQNLQYVWSFVAHCNFCVIFILGTFGYKIFFGLFAIISTWATNIFLDLHTWIDQRFTIECTHHSSGLPVPPVATHTDCLVWTPSL